MPLALLRGDDDDDDENEDEDEEDDGDNMVPSESTSEIMYEKIWIISELYRWVEARNTPPRDATFPATDNQFTTR